jgi:hypothetical protein
LSGKSRRPFHRLDAVNATLHGTVAKYERKVAAARRGKSRASDAYSRRLAELQFDDARRNLDWARQDLAEHAHRSYRRARPQRPAPVRRPGQPRPRGRRAPHRRTRSSRATRAGPDPDDPEPAGPSPQPGRRDTAGVAA